ncbi:5-oxoprolinase subunit PxpA [Vreelandella maris]|uniref:5-oxoprolinase subunit PxpA n=1 Tax=Vreelandella maris TaxID=2729617 RepID=A0A7Y6VA05_9GAMM|nr:5-oxoprolinase subunit PxpA [Halomonas maris]NVF15537.1 5-oxoprolinase subunit PxpA [Halomonas maris]|tara:strand:+ start:3020 stop:3778 length:759 start_codon:yes stop_codon:yes gene_type:complete
MTTTIDLNADMGESFGAWSIGDGVDVDIMPLISSANIAAGFHAGDPTIMQDTLRLASRYGVGIGVHPGFGDLVGFGRRAIAAPADELVNDAIYQLGALRELAHLEGLSMHHFKLHGALFMHAAKDADFAQRLCAALAKVAPELPIYCLAGSALDKAAETLGLPTVHEFYADRDYNDEGSIVFVRKVQRLDPQQVAEKVLRACQQGTVESVNGKSVAVSFQSVCIHSDTPGALALVKAVRHALDNAGIKVAAP